MENSRIGFIGAGNMANSLIRGLLGRGVAPGRLLAADIDSDKLEQLQSDCGIQVSTAAEIASTADVVVLAVKPQVMKTACRELHAALQGRDCLIVSVAAGITLEHLGNWLGRELALVRCMPNTPALVGKGATALYANDRVSTSQQQLAEAILSAVGLAIWLQSETDIDAVTALSGSGPAYFFLLMEAMQEVALEMGLDADVARQLTCQTALGAAELASRSQVSTAELRRQVTSPGGTTEQALKRFEQGGLRELVRQALLAAQQRSRELARDFGS
ncbi:MAG: pyrroline-5-carboxylate reductase [Pseudomonadales bacterium]|nr:pyrroline-5-carboxylate reductase [Pseudomonadales bacterium]